MMRDKAWKDVEMGVERKKAIIFHRRKIYFMDEWAMGMLLKYK